MKASEALKLMAKVACTYPMFKLEHSDRIMVEGGWGISIVSRYEKKSIGRFLVRPYNGNDPKKIKEDNELNDYFIQIAPDICYQKSYKKIVATNKTAQGDYLIIDNDYDCLRTFYQYDNFYDEKSIMEQFSNLALKYKRIQTALKKIKLEEDFVCMQKKP